MIKENFDYDVLRDILIDEGVAIGVEKGVAIGVEKGVEIGVEIGVEKENLRLTRRLLERRLGAIPQRFEAFLESATQAQLDELFDNALKVESYDELKLPATIVDPKAQL